MRVFCGSFAIIRLLNVELCHSENPSRTTSPKGFNFYSKSITNRHLSDQIRTGAIFSIFCGPFVLSCSPFFHLSNYFLPGFEASDKKCSRIVFAPYLPWVLHLFNHKKKDMERAKTGREDTINGAPMADTVQAHILNTSFRKPRILKGKKWKEERREKRKA